MSIASNMIGRRQLLAAAALAPLSTLSLAGSGRPEGGRLVLVILRGGLDGLTAVPALGDLAFAPARGALAQFGEPTLPLDGFFALHPALVQLHAMYGRRELALVQATGLPYKERSHFEAQQVLESGGSRPHEITTGWLGRALASRQSKGLALQAAVPLVLRGPAEIDSWAPSALPDPAPELLARLEKLYEGDAALSQALMRARGLRADGATMPAANTLAGMVAGAARPPLALTLAQRATQFLARPDGPQAAVLEMGGWDSHANQVSPQGPLANNLRGLDAALGALRDGLQATPGLWQRSLVLVMTEFGREVAINGTQGTDHGSGGAAFVFGGTVRGGRVLGDWPGLASKDRFEGRDLRITTDLRAVLKTVLQDHLQVARSTVEREVLPGTAGLAPLSLLRG
ncbi:DUF1501 domain-containing protein [Aquabacterium sp.]|uniref:DUF1501 domain-containing protein n=1 Tax=Aquabacterium sp. TaxID=1872578 RepID=UPI002BDD7D33|nr:DUF1501 domain-containing protein [Aquabacterium sp.]HSW07358.1 DUF1501 domain-containing protein [Aquabacterium sp.]